MPGIRITIWPIDSRIQIKRGYFFMSHSEKNSRLFYPDFIRVIAFLCILLFHFQVETSHFAVFRGIPAISSGICEIDLGQLGVSLFFILSGASLMISKKPFDAVSFYKKRFFHSFSCVLSGMGRRVSRHPAFVPGRASMEHLPGPSF